MDHDIDAINASLRLGDPAWAPDGTVVRSSFTGRICAVKWLRQDEDYIWAVGLGPNGSTGYLYLPAMEVISVPSSAPPFSMWRRL